ncbi:MAG: xanthine dehydrogenase [Marmoricola sp.]|jgi:carbon-monoxide dehydrogenase large subunit|nr:xanthine dehydrogenase [Marmoricola sp.]
MTLTHSPAATANPDLDPGQSAGSNVEHGERVRRKDGDLILTGRGRYLDDIELPRLTHAAVLRSPHPHARIISVNLDAALRMPGVVTALSGGQAMPLAGPVPHYYDPAVAGERTAEFRCLAVEKVLYVGQPVAAVVAETLHEAEAALKFIEVDYEVLPFVTDELAALEPGAPRIFEDWDDNVLIRSAFAEGDTDAAFAGAAHTLREEIRIQRYNTAPMETRGYIATWGLDGVLTFHGSSQNPHPLRSNLATSLGVPETKIRVVAARLGGGFGHKFHGYPEEPLVCVLSKIVGRPVQWLETRSDSMLVGAREMVHHIEVAFEDDGEIVAWRNLIHANIGALGSMAGWGMSFVAGMAFPGPYRVKNYDVTSLAIVTNKAPWNGARGYGKESAALAIERTVDRVAQELGLDPVQVRRRNFIPSDEFPYWTAAKRLDSGNYDGVMDKVVELAGYDALRLEQVSVRGEGRLFGVGVAFELTPEGGDFPGDLVRGFDTSTVRVDPSGDVRVLTGVTSPGTGNETGIAQVVARELGVSVDTVTVYQGDTDVSPYGYGNASSRSMNVGGGSALLAARDVKERLALAAGVLMEDDPAALTFADGWITTTNGHRMRFSEVARAVFTQSIAIPAMNQPQLESTRTYGPDNLLHVPDEHGRVSPYPTYPNSGHIASVEVDRDTGVVRLLSYAAVDDCGTVINPTMVEGQFFGAIVMGIGGALWEELPYDNSGRPVAGTFKHYLMPRTPDLPEIRIGSQVTPSPFTILGTKGAGEGGVAGAVACIANAVNDALRPLGVTAHQMPLSGPRVLEAINTAVPL